MHVTYVLIFFSDSHLLGPLSQLAILLHVSPPPRSYGVSVRTCRSMIGVTDRSRDAS